MVKAELLGKVVMTHYSHKIYRIDDVDFEKNPSTIFHLRKENRDVSYAEYYQTHYNLTVLNMTQPLLVSRPSHSFNGVDVQPSYLIPEFCGMTGLTDDQK